MIATAAGHSIAGACLREVPDNIVRIKLCPAEGNRAGPEASGQTGIAVERWLEPICEAAFGLGDPAAALLYEETVSFLTAALPVTTLRGQGVTRPVSPARAGPPIRAIN
jgi:hypothetical protein